MAGDQDKSFLGTGWSFPPEFQRNDGVLELQTVSLEADIKESLSILLATAPGERVMQPTFGCGLKTMIFENVDETAITEMKDLIERAILFFETRIDLDDIYIDTDNIYDGLMEIDIHYTIVSTNTRSNIVYPFYFQEGTELDL
ncbi:MAG: GPW/gp25 family protein [Proteobacteria bacterium]|jgi:phage baseplate assembly protein W|nr:GPW/gp25 family protein [Pseudomonadota bacterium]MDA0927597.1 GPW/gp25 family protein [Pseudomonadota bacterium]